MMSLHDIAIFRPNQELMNVRDKMYRLIVEWRVHPIIYVTIAMCLILAGCSLERHEYRNCTVLRLLNVQPYPDDGVFAGFDSGLDLVPAAHLAAKEINNRSDILTGFDLEIVDIDSEACGREIITKGLINFYRELVSQDPSRCIVGVIGFVCSSVTNVLVPIISHQNIGYVILANSVSPAHRNIKEYPNLFHTISPSSVHNEALLSLMQRFNWRRIGVVYDSFTIIYRTTATDFIQQALNFILSKIELTTLVPIISNSPNVISEAFDSINAEEARITYWQGSDDQNAVCLCEAYRRQLLYPGFVYILRSNPHSVDNLLAANTNCNKKEMLHAMEGVFMLDYRLEVDDDTVLISGWNYSEFRQRYAKELEEYAGISNETLHVNIYGNSFYDQVWAFGLALNNSLPFIHSESLSFSDYTINGNPGPISRIIKRELMKLSFQGASGQIDFSDDHGQRTPTYVNIFQVQKGKPQLIGVYNPYSHNVTLTEATPLINDIPPDTFDTVHRLLPPWLGICLLTSQGILFGLITTNLFLILKWKNETDIKATSPYLSLLMMIGCYVLCVLSMIQIANRTFVLSTMVMKSLCYLETWTSLGTDLILAVLFLKLMRIYQIFRTFGKISEYWHDQYIFIYILAICLGKAVLVILWNSTDSIGIKVHKEYVKDPDQLPYYIDTVICYSSRIWLVATELYSGVLLFLVVILAVATRHIKRENFKDTKKINTFIFSVLIVNVSSIALRIFFLEVGNQIGDDIAEWLPSFSTPLLCQVCLLFPKILPLAFKLINVQYNNYVRNS